MGKNNIFFDKLRRTFPCVLLLFVGIFQSAVAQTTVARKYLVLLKDKASSPYSINQPNQFLSQRAIQRRQRQGIQILERDLPVNPTYVSQLKQTGATVRYTSRWFNAVLLEATDAVLTKVLALSFVKGLEFNRPLAGNRVSLAPGNDPLGRIAITTRANKFGQVTATDLPYGSSQTQLSQIGVDKMHSEGYRGEGMLIALMDAGFRNANQVAFLQPLFQQNRVIGTKDFVEHETNVYDDDDHGLHVLSILAATADNQLYGAAFKASYLLLKTEDVNSETQIEEANWLIGAEYADSTGADIIESSLGYTQFDDPTTSYTYADMNGQKALSSRAARIAAEAGMVVVVSAGNEGNDPWHYIAAPADAGPILTVGAVDRNGARAVFSSFGPAADGRIKPDVDAFGLGTIIGLAGGTIGAGSGTSYSAPLIAGLAAGFWQANPTLKAADVVRLLRESGNQYSQPDAALGYGIPDFNRAMVLTIVVDRLTVLPNPFSSTDLLTILQPAPGTSTNVDMTLTDVAGRVIWRQQTRNSPRITVTLPTLALSLPTGMYYLTLVTDEQKQTVRLLKN